MKPFSKRARLSSFAARDRIEQIAADDGLTLAAEVIELCEALEAVRDHPGEDCSVIAKNALDRFRAVLMERPQ